MFGLEAWMCLRCPWSLTTTYPTTENFTYTGKLGLHVGECGWITFPQGGSYLSFLLPSQNWPVRQIRSKRCSDQFCEEWRHPHPARHWAVLLHPDRWDAHERWVQACPSEAAALLHLGTGVLHLKQKWQMLCFATCLIPKPDPSLLPLGKNLGTAVGALYCWAVAPSPLGAYLHSLIFSYFSCWSYLKGRVYQGVVLFGSLHNSILDPHPFIILLIICSWVELHLGTRVNNVLTPTHVFQ